MNNNLIDLTVNGRIFPLWIMKNFKKYKLPEIIRDKSIDPCNLNKNINYNELRLYQRFVGEYLDYKSPYKNILIYHGLGSGKTASAINIYNVLYSYTPNWNVFILIKASLKDQPWLVDLKKYLGQSDNKNRWKNIKFIHYDAPRADRQFLDAVKEADSSYKNLYIIEEAHNFITNVYNNITSRKGKRGYVIYDYIIQEKKDNNDTRVVLLSATPAVNNPYELALIFNLLRPGIFPDNEQKFNEIYISQGKDKILNPDTKNMYQRRIMGLVSYYYGATNDLYAQKKVLQKNLVMDKYQFDIYRYYEDIEKKLESSSKKSSGNSVYKSYTRQASNFVFPVMGDNYTGENRPRPSKFKLSEKEAIKLLEGKADSNDIDNLQEDNYKLYLDTMNKYLKKFYKYLQNINIADKDKNHTLSDDIEKFKTIYNYKFTDFYEKEKQKSGLFNAMYACSCKMTAILFYVLKSKGSVLIYSNYVKMEGLEIFKIYMSFFGYMHYTDPESKDYYRYTEFVGSVEREIRRKNLLLFNNIENLDGSKIKIILISPAGAEGISLKNVRQVHIMEPYWNEVRIEQLIGRAIRMCSHKDLPMEERFVHVYRYNAIRKDGNISTDQEIQDLAFVKKNLINSFLLAIKEIAIDCELFKNHNMINEKYQCFQFNQNSYLDQYIGPAYKMDLDYDRKINNGLNSINSIIKEIEVIKIKAVQKTNKGFSNEESYWYNRETGIVYDIDLYYPVGRVLIIDGIPNKLDKNTYIMSEVISIPTKG